MKSSTLTRFSEIDFEVDAVICLRVQKERFNDDL